MNRLKSTAVGPKGKPQVSAEGQQRGVWRRFVQFFGVRRDLPRAMSIFNSLDRAECFERLLNPADFALDRRVQLTRRADGVLAVQLLFAEGSGIDKGAIQTGIGQGPICTRIDTQDGAEKVKLTRERFWRVHATRMARPAFNANPFECSMAHGDSLQCARTQTGSFLEHEDATTEIGKHLAVIRAQHVIMGSLAPS